MRQVVASIWVTVTSLVIRLSAAPSLVSVTSCQSKLAGSIASDITTSSEVMTMLRGLVLISSSDTGVGAVVSIVQLRLAWPTPATLAASVVPAARTVST